MHRDLCSTVAVRRAIDVLTPALCRVAHSIPVLRHVANHDHTGLDEIHMRVL